MNNNYVYKDKMEITFNNLEEELQPKLWQVGNDLRTLMRRRAPVDTGILKNSIEFEVAEDGAINFFMVDYGFHVEYCTKPHKIRAKNKKVLSDGKKIFGKEVQHPGTTAQPFIRPSLHQLTKILKKRLNGAKITVKLSD